MANTNEPLDLGQSRNAIPTEPSNNMRTAAADAVFCTYELVEKIILALPPEDILLAAKVNKTTFSIVEESRAIRYRLYHGRFQTLPNDGMLNTDSWFVYFDLHFATIIIRRLGEVEVVSFIYLGAKGGLKIVAGRNRSVKFDVVMKDVGRIEFRDWAVQTIDVSRTVQLVRVTDVVGYLNRYHPPPKQLKARQKPVPRFDGPRDHKTMIEAYGMHGRKRFW
ncbi:hypothetical protein LTR37_007616 [Vermiconidia calcicola]|uniref:Uncharacterized protein n=1 Tax=Vermiconidia calcicola TaxID=1690605 RepID=A0ACC3NCX6_9PEZI|nr:hypothetical protein LTR37_007616 [Vermiconidia calcicola]